MEVQEAAVQVERQARVFAGAASLRFIFALRLLFL